VARTVIERIPEKWICWGKCRRSTHTMIDGKLEPSYTYEYFISIKLPWKVRYYDIENDIEGALAHPMWVLRFRPGIGYASHS
jgi:hypothetical protein